MIGWMPNSRRQYGPTLTAEVLDIGVDERNEDVCSGNGQCATGEGIILQIDQQ
jgi:hypothetical protein